MNPISLTLLAFAATSMPTLAQDPTPKALSAPGDQGERLNVPADRAAAWAEFQQRRPGAWHAYWNHATGTPNAVYGPGLDLPDWRGNTIEEARRQAVNLLQAEAALLGLGNCDLRESIGARMGRLWSFKFDQYYQGLPVVGGRADVRVGMTGRIAMFGSAAFTIPADFVTTPAITAETANVAALQALTEPLAANADGHQPAAPRLVIWGDVHSNRRSAVRLAWEVAVRNLDAGGQGTLGRFYVDASNGTVLQFVDDKHSCMPGCSHASHGGGSNETAVAAPLPLPVPTIVEVRGWVRTGLSPTSASVQVQMAGLEINVPGIGLRTTDQNGRITIDITAPVNINIGALDGRHHLPITGGTLPSVSATVQPGNNTVLTIWAAGASQPQVAQTDSAFWIDRVNQWARGIVGNGAQMTTASNIDVNVNIAQNCNAFYDPNVNSINFYSAGSGCPNTAYSTVILHEWGHGLDDRFGGISQTNGLSEGWGDIVSMYYVDNPEVGFGIFTPGVALRTGTNNRQYPSGSAVHEQGESWMGFAWKLRDRLALGLGSRAQAIALSNDIVVGTIVADATTQPNAVLEVFLADDDDFNMNNGTPHDNEITWACAQHSLPLPTFNGPANDYCGGATPVVVGVNGPYNSTGATGYGSPWTCGGQSVGVRDLWFRYTTQWPGQLTASTCGLTTLDTRIKLLSGTCGALTVLACNDNSCGTQSSVTANVSAGTYYIVVDSGPAGAFSLDIDFVGPMQAASASQGTGCGTSSKAFYELFPAGPLDLGGQSLRLRNMGTYYRAEPGGSLLPLTGNTFQTPHGDDTVLNFVLSVPMPYPGGSSQFLEVCSNGFVSVGPGNGAPVLPNVAQWLNSARARWGSWHDFNPAAAGSGKIHYDIAGPIAYVTWNNVYTYNTTQPRTWQIQFDQYTGDVTMVWQSMAGGTLPTLVGYTAQGPNVDLGNMDLSAAIPATFFTGAFNGAPLALSGTLPQLGTTLVLTTTNVPSTSPVALQTLGVQGYPGGIDLSVIGMPGCRQYSEALVIHTLLPAAGQAVYTLPIPASVNLAGYQLKAQSAALVAGYNAASIITSNGVWMTVGI